MLSLIKLRETNVYDDKGGLLGALKDVAFEIATGKCLLMTDGNVYLADGVTKTVEGLVASNPQFAEGKFAPLTGKCVYDVTGKCLGTIRNVTFNKTLTLCKCTCDTGEELTRRRLQAVGDVVIARVFKSKTDKTALQTVTKKAGVKKETDKTTVERQPTPQQKIVEIPQRTQMGAAYPVKRRYGDFSFLLGKVADKNITNFFNEVMIRRGDVVTKDVLRQAKISGKLIELCLHVK